MKTRDVMVSPVITVPEPSASVRRRRGDAAAAPRQRGAGRETVTGRLVGIVSEGDLLHRV